MITWTAVLDIDGDIETVNLELPCWFTDDEVMDALTDEITNVYGTALEVVRVTNDEI